MVIRAVVYSGWTSTLQTRAPSKTSVMAGKIQVSARMSEHTQHTARQEDDCSVHIHTHTHSTQPLEYTLPWTHILYTYTHDSASSLTRAQSFSTASSMSSWCPILCTPNFSRSWEVNWSRSRPDKCHSETGY